MTPGRPKGRTDVRIISHWVAPSASAPSLCAVGVWSKTSRESAVTIGRTMIARTTPMKQMVPPLMPVGAKSGNQPSLSSMNDCTGLNTGAKAIRPQRP